MFLTWKFLAQTIIVWILQGIISNLQLCICNVSLFWIFHAVRKEQVRLFRGLSWLALRTDSQLQATSRIMKGWCINEQNSNNIFNFGSIVGVRNYWDNRPKTTNAQICITWTNNFQKGKIMAVLKYILITIFALLEVAFFAKFLKAHKDFELIREVAIIVIMLIVALVIFLITKI